MFAEGVIDTMRTVEKLENKRQQRQEPPKIFVLFLIALSIMIAGLLFINSAFFSIGSIVVDGNQYISSDDIIRIAGIDGNINIFRINTGELKKRLLCDLRIDDVEISRKFPATIVISVKERQPLAYVASGFGFVEIDRQGVVLSAFKTLRKINVPMITGVSLGDVYVGDKADRQEVMNVLPYLASLDENTLNQISEVNVASQERILAYTVGSVHIRIGNNEQLAAKAKMTNQILKEIKDKQTAVEYIDLTYATPFIKFKN